MVRVISVHNFTSQSVQTVEQPTACTTAPPDRFLLALMSNCVEVRDLKNNAELLFTFPTIDEVAQICYSLNGDYVATLESKFNRQNREQNFVRVYVNWDSIATLQQSKMTSSGVSLGSSECGMVQPMRARIAGRVTPTSNQSDLGSLEMIEIPVKRNPHFISCCPISGNLLILSNNIINIYKFRVKTHDISKMKFIDFNDTGIRIELTFEPTKIEMCENYIAAMNRDNMHLFKIYKKSSKDSNSKKNSAEFPQRGPDDTIDFAKLLREEMNEGSEKITIHLPSIVRENSLIHKQNPFTFWDKEMKATIFSNSPLDNSISQYKVRNLIQLRLLPVLIEDTLTHVLEEYKTFVMKPLYIDEVLNKSKKDADNENMFRSEFSRNLNSVTCMVATQQEGYLFHFEDIDNQVSADHCIAIYPFTAPVFQLVIEDYFLHALTVSGLETYTLRNGHKLCHTIKRQDDFNNACPPVDDGICLVGLRPFLGVEQILSSNNHLLLLANADSSPTHSVGSNSSSNAVYWTLYCLESPTPKTIFNDFLIVANEHRFSSLPTYRNLMNEAHVILRVALFLKKWTTTEDCIKLARIHKENMDDISEMFRGSCALLGDHFIMSTSKKKYQLAIPYYKMAGTQAAEVIRRIKKIQEQLNVHSTKGLVHYLKHIMLEIRSAYEADKLFTPNSRQTFLDDLLKLLETSDFEDLPYIILKSKILQEYSTDKLIIILSTTKIPDDFTRQDEKNLALCLLYIQKNNLSQAKFCLKQIDSNNLHKLLLDHWEILFENNSKQQGPKGITNFSEVGDLIIKNYTEKFAHLLVTLVMKQKVINLSRLIKIFMEYLPSSIGAEPNTATQLLQLTLEEYFEQLFSGSQEIDHSRISHEKGASEALKLLVRSYLSQLQILQLKEENNKKKEENSLCNGDAKNQNGEAEIIQNPLNMYELFDDNIYKKDAYLFERCRYEYLQKMPPFQVEIVSKMYSMCLENHNDEKEIAVNDEADGILVKLQAILCSPVVPKGLNSEVETFLSMNSNLRGKLSIQSIILPNKDAVPLLIENCPQCLPQFGKDRLKKTDEWKFLIASLQQKILRLSTDEKLDKICFFYKKTLKDVLSQVARGMNLEELVQVFPQRINTNGLHYNNEESNDGGVNGTNRFGKDVDSFESGMVYTDRELDILNEIQDYEPYIVICRETMNANQMRKLIIATSQQLLRTLNF
ncbi:uncharacterized protein LOC123319874 isoform X2 [Coccinella septempunctata]|uniref:uncharacterized protein LOC123319874 isoform X2 n=1 Tax=Coccinella septempunctata TaxID=41139 RepID=UPI001D0931AE|nr:uncharacterized protein LOC123319874 isoform X2 [Coccinella septempunctata]